jgi:glutaredoxin
MKLNHVAGTQRPAKLMLYALSTCVWCKKTRRLLESLEVEYDYVYVDELNVREQQAVTQAVEQWNPSGSLPTLVINDQDAVIGFDEDEIRGKLGL